LSRVSAPRGTFDILPEQAPARARIERVASEVLEPAGYGRIETPTFESTELFSRGVGEATDIVQKEMYSFDDGGGRSLTLRPEGTAPVCRAYVEYGMHKRPLPVRLYYLSSFFRAERPQAGRYRQFWQLGIEALGSDAPEVDAETIVLLATILQRIGVNEARLRLSSLGSPDTRAAYRHELAAYLHKHADRLAPAVRDRIELNPLRAFDSTDPGTQAVMTDAPTLLDRLSPADGEHFAAVRGLLDGAGIDYEIDPTLVRGLDYYTRTLFEFTSDALGAQSGVGGGGRYDGLVEALGGPATPGVGWAAGIERMLMAADEVPEPAPALDLYLAASGSDAAAFEALIAARQAGLSAQMEVMGRSPKGQQKQAERLGARFFAQIEGEQVRLREMSSGAEETVERGSLVERVRGAV
jgi:histidyl-tRNA synthetase